MRRGHRHGPRRRQFLRQQDGRLQILPKTLTDHSTISVADIGVQTYTGDAITPTPAVTYWSDAGAALSLTGGR